VSVDLGYTVNVCSLLGKQLWNGRKKTSKTSFIPGLMDFHIALEKLGEGADGVPRQNEIDAAVKALIVETRAKASALKNEVVEQAPSGFIVEPIFNTEDHKTIQFKCEITRRAAVLVACFDELARWDNLASS